MTLPSSYTAPLGPLPEKQRIVLEFIEAELLAGKAFPSDAAIASHMEWKSASSARDCLYRLQWRGYIKLHPRQVLKDSSA